jgi:hypothetical protein
MNSVVTVKNQRLGEVQSDTGGRDFSRLGVGRSSRVGVPLVQVDISRRVNVAGRLCQNQRNEELVDSLGLIKSGVTAYDIKTGALSPWLKFEQN